MDYGVPEVRQHILKVAREMVERYDIDGLDLDFMRWPVYFKNEEVKANTPLMTEFVREIRSILEEGSRKKNRRLLLSVRVPTRIGEGKVINAPEYSPELECLGIGLDVRRWIKEGLNRYGMPHELLLHGLADHDPEHGGVAGLDRGYEVQAVPYHPHNGSQRLWRTLHLSRQPTWCGLQLLLAGGRRDSTLQHDVVRACWGGGSDWGQSSRLRNRGSWMGEPSGTWVTPLC